jgi:tetratricopeptide (TPR) repeat protein
VVATWQALAALEAARAEKEAKSVALAREAETATVLDFLEKQIFAAARPEKQAGGLGPEVTLRRALEAALPVVQSKFARQPLVEARLRMTLGKSFRYLGDARIAADQFERARAIYTEQRGPESAETLESMNDLATAYADLGREREALILREKTLELRLRILGPDHVDTLGSMRNLANSYAAANRRQEALELDQKTFEALKATLGPDDPQTLSCMNNLALSNSALRQYKEALALQQELVKRYQAALPPDHPDTLVAMGNLAKTYSDLKRFEDARKLTEEVIALQKAKTGARHPDTLQSMYSLAITYHNLGRFDDALKLHQEVLALRKEKLGEDHYQTLLSMWGVAVNLLKLNRGPEAIPLIDTCFAHIGGKENRADFMDLADLRLRYFLKAKDAAGCRESVEIWENVHVSSPIGLYNAACFRALTAGVILETDKSTTAKQTAAAESDRAMTWLHQAVAAGFKDLNSLKKDPDLAALRERADFKKLVADLEQPAAERDVRK